MQTAGEASRPRWPFAAGTGLEISVSTAVLLAALLGATLWPGILSNLFLLLSSVAWISLLFLFRDPERTGPSAPNLVLSPADGRVLSVEEIEERDFVQGPARRVSIFLSLFDVHVNRSPVSGVVQLVRHRPGRFHQAFRPLASQENERNLLGIQDGEDRVLLKQIAGILARRVVCRACPGDHLTAGQRFGLIKFGSRVEVFLPPHYAVCVRKDDRVIAGVTVIARKAYSSHPADSAPLRERDG